MERDARENVVDGLDHSFHSYNRMLDIHHLSLNSGGILITGLIFRHTSEFTAERETVP